MSNNSETVRETRNMSMNHDYKTGVALSDSVNKTCVKRFLADKSLWHHFRLAIKSRYLRNHTSQIKFTMERYQEVMVTLSEIVMKNRIKRPLADKSRWRHIPLEIKPRNLGNYASQKKSYFGTLSGSHGRSFKIPHEKSSEAPPGGEITMTSYLVVDKTSLSWKPCIPDKRLYGSLSWSLGRLII